MRGGPSICVRWMTFVKHTETDETEERGVKGGEAGGPGICVQWISDVCETY